MDRRLPTAALLSLLFISLTAAAAIMDDGCTRELWEQRPDGEYIQVRRNVCGGSVIGREALDGSAAAAVIGRETPLGGSAAAAVIGRAAVVPPIVGPVIREDAANEMTMAAALTATQLPPSPSPPVVESSPPSTPVSAGKILLLKKLKLLALGALMLG
jgi:hypothetical protein